MITLTTNPPPANPEWRAALALFEMARGDLEACDAEADTELDFYANARTEAMDRILQHPAPDFAAVATKLEIYVSEDCAGLTCEDGGQYPYIKSILADVRRLAGDATNGQ